MKKILSMVLVLMLALCATSFAESDKSDQLYIEVACNSNLSYFYDHMLGCETAGEELGVRTEYVGPAEYDIDGMIAAFETAIAKQPNGIVVIGFEDTLGPVIDKATEAGIPVITVDGDVNDCSRICFVGTGNYNAGYTGGQYLAEAIGGKGQIALMTKPGQANLEERIQGYQVLWQPIRILRSCRSRTRSPTPSLPLPPPRRCCRCIPTWRASPALRPPVVPVPRPPCARPVSRAK